MMRFDGCLGSNGKSEDIQVQVLVVVKGERKENESIILLKLCSFVSILLHNGIIFVNLRGLSRRGCIDLAQPSASYPVS